MPTELPAAPNPAPDVSGPTELGRATSRGAMWSALSQASRIGLRLVSVSVLGRLLSPEDFGIMTMAALVGDFAAIFQDMGLGAVAIQRKDLTDAEKSNLFWLNVAFGALTMFGTMAAAPVMAFTMKQPVLIGVVCLMSVQSLLNAIALQHAALLRRNLSFKPVAIAEITSNVLALLLSITLARMGARYWALVIQTVFQSTVYLPIVWLSSGWRPKGWSRDANTRGLVGFGASLSASWMLAYVMRNAANWVIGRLLGTAALGNYSRANQLLVWPVQQITGPIVAVAVPALSRLQSDPEGYRAFYRKLQHVLAVLGLPVVGGLTAMAPEFVSLALGDKWTDVPILFRCLAPAAAVFIFDSSLYLALTPIGQVGRLLRFNLIYTVLLIAGLWIGAQFGIFGAALGFSVSMALLRPLSIAIGMRGSHVSARDQLAVIWRPLLATLMAVGVTMLVSSQLPWKVAALRSAVLIPLYGSALLLGWVAAPGGWQALKADIRDVRELRRKKK